MHCDKKIISITYNLGISKEDNFKLPFNFIMCNKPLNLQHRMKEFAVRSRLLINNLSVQTRIVYSFFKMFHKIRTWCRNRGIPIATGTEVELRNTFVDETMKWITKKNDVTMQTACVTKCALNRLCPYFSSWFY